MNTKEIATWVRQELKRRLPEWKFSVTVKNYSGGCSINLALMEGPEQVVMGRHEYVPGGGGTYRSYNAAHPFPGYAQLNHYQLMSKNEADQEKMLSNGEYLTAKGWEVMRTAVQILDTHHWDKSDISIDYFCCNFYMHVNIGRWDKDYTVRKQEA